jgi:hypothetical protein
LALTSFGVVGTQLYVFLVALSTLRGNATLLQASLVLPHTGRGMSTVTTWSERCTSLGSMGNPTGTQCPPRSMWSSAVPHVRCPINHRSSIPLVPNYLRSSLRARCLPPEGVNLRDFEANNSDIGRDGCVALHHRLEQQGAISSLPLSLLWTQIICGLA